MIFHWPNFILGRWVQAVSFVKEKEIVKFQILQLGVKLMNIKFDDEMEKLEKVFNYCIQLGMKDISYNINTFARMIKVLFVKESI
jgi:hypothetical protein